jgi:lysozyme inhibitor LprI
MARVILACFCVGALLPPVSLHPHPTPTASPTLEELKADFEKQDAELNQIYKETMARLPPEQQKELKKSEVEWIKYRDQEGTTKDPELHWQILSFNTRERIKDIRADFPLESGPYPPPGYSEAKDEGAESPKGDFVIKVFRGEGDDFRRQEAWIVSKDDPTQRKRLPGKTGTSSTEHFISPDARWIVRWQHDNSDEDSAYLYRRKDGLVFESITDPLSELAWEFFEKTPPNKHKYKIDTKNLDKSFIRFVSWSGDGKKVRLSLTGLVSHKWTIDDWQCDYSMEKKAFELPASLSEHNAKAVEAFKED